MHTKDILELAALSRINITEADAESYQKDFIGIIDYITTISSLDIPTEEYYQTNLTTNMTRSDDEMYEPGSFTDDLLALAPDRDGNYFKVKKVL
jgi:aspartyl/glutamyl-tRNA(Asn/Gln) amidotransferase C subunit